MTLKTGQVWSGLLVCKDSTGALATPSVGPVGALYVDGVVDAASVTISGSNPYKWTVTLPSLTAGQNVSMYITATIAGVATASTVAEEVIDTYRVSDISGSAGDTLESISSQIDGIGSGTGAALNFASNLDNISAPLKSVTFVGVQSSGTYASTSAEDGTYHQITHSANAIDIVYRFNIGSGRSCSKITWKGYLVGSNDTITVQAYNGSSWDTRRIITGTNVATNSTVEIDLLGVHTGTGSDAGLVFIRFVCSGMTAPILYTDLLLAQAQNLGQTIGYADGAIWIDTLGSNVNTTPFVDGTADNPVSTMAAANTIAASVNIHRFRVLSGSTITLAQQQDNDAFIGKSWNLALGGQSISGAYIEGATVTGTCTAASQPTFSECLIGAVTLPPVIIFRSGLGVSSGTLTAGGAGQYVFVDCYSLVPGSGTPVFIFTGLGSTTGINFRRWSGGSNITVDSNCTITIEVVTGGGQTIVNGGGNVEVRGICRAVTLTCTAPSVSQIACVTGVVTVNGTGGTVNVYGVSSSITDNSSGSVTINDYSVSDSQIGGLSTLTQADILSDATPFAGANIDALISSRSVFDPSTQDVNVSAASVLDIQNGLSTLQQADILSDATPFAGANIDAAISSRSSFSPGVDDVNVSVASVSDIQSGLSTFNPATQDVNVSAASITNIQTGLSTFDPTTQDVNVSAASVSDIQSGLSTLTQADILSDATPFAGANIDAAISTRFPTSDWVEPLSAANTAAAVLDATAASYNDPNSIGEKINSAGSGGVDIAALAAAIAELLVANGLVSSNPTLRWYEEFTRGDSISRNFTDLGDLTTVTKSWFTIKTSLSQADTAAILMIRSDAGLVYINGAAATTPANGSISVTGTGQITVVLKPVESAKIPPAKYYFDLQVLRTGGTIETVRKGTATFVSDVTRATS